MKKLNALVMVVYYKGSERYTPDYFSSIRNQSSDEFDLLIINDNVQAMKYSNLNVNTIEINISEKMTPSMIRNEGIRYALDNDYCTLVFSDIDDYFSNNRIELSIKGSRIDNFVFNKINTVDQNKKLLQRNINKQTFKKENIYSYKQILDFNLLGLSHTAINLESIREFSIPDEILATDWWIFTILLLHGYSGVYIPEATTYYRQTDDNLVGMKQTLDANRLLFGIKVKYIHYNCLIQYCKRNDLNFAIEEYIVRLNEINDLSNAINDSAFQSKYIETINANIDKIYRGWWSEILTLTQWRLYEN